MFLENVIIIMAIIIIVSNNTWGLAPPAYTQHAWRAAPIINWVQRESKEERRGLGPGALLHQCPLECS